jgi:hypothetical protein
LAQIYPEDNIQQPLLEISMPQFFVKQPDGKLALFSTVVDDFIEIGLSDDEAIDKAVESLGAQPNVVEAIIEKARQDEPFWPAKDRGDGQNRWRQALNGLAVRHGIETVTARVRDMGLAEDAIPQEALLAAEEARIARVNLQA